MLSKGQRMRRRRMLLCSVFLRTDVLENNGMGCFQTRGVNYEILNGVLSSFLFSLVLPTPSQGAVTGIPGPRSCPQRKRQIAQGATSAGVTWDESKTCHAPQSGMGRSIWDAPSWKRNSQVKRTGLCGFQELGKPSNPSTK